MARFQFPEWTERFKKWVTVLLVGAPVYLISLMVYGMSPEAIRIGYMPEQPVPYSHALHVSELGIDCRYCHNTVEESAHSAIPTAETCMNCHARIHTDKASLAPIREAALEDGKPIEWIRVTDLPDYVMFDHSAHVTRGVGCETCHGRVDLMEKVEQVAPLTMSWCLDCHRDPAPILRDPATATVMGVEPDRARGEALARANNINPKTDCSTCHR